MPYSHLLLGRLHAPDKRDLAYPMKAATKSAGCFGGGVVKVVGRTWKIGPVLNQGDSPKCVAYSWAGWLQSEPVITMVSSPQDENAFYARAQLLDEWPGEDYDGTSVRAGAKVMAEMGHIGQYVWAQSEQEIWDFVSTTGPVVMGTNWYDTMFYPDGSGYLNLKGAVAGGHAWLIYQTNPVSKTYGMVNSWGTLWGKNGTALIRREDVARLLSEDGEACAGVELPAA